MNGGERYISTAGWLFVAASFGCTQALAASFDCGKAKMQEEKVICANAELSKLDEQLSKEYKAALDRSKCTPETVTSMNDPKGWWCDDGSWGDWAVRDEQRQWLKQRNTCGGDATCIKASYLARMAEVTRDAIDNLSGWWMREGMGNELCNSMHRLLVPYRAEEISACPAGVALTLSGLKEAEGWRELNPLEHMELINKLRVYSALGDEAYFGRFKNNPYGESLRKKAEMAKTHRFAQPLSRDEVERRVRELGLRLRVMNTPPLRFSRIQTDGSEIIPLEEKTVLEIRIHRNKIIEDRPISGNCPLPQRDEAVHHYFVTLDLTGPDPDRVIFGSTIRNGWMVDYKGHLHILDAHSMSIAFNAPNKDHILDPNCEIEWHSKNRWPELNILQSKPSR